MVIATRATYNRRPSIRKEPHVTEQEQRDDEPRDETMEDLDVPEEQTDDVTGGAMRGRRAKKKLED
jgi:hypothetical protein